MSSIQGLRIGNEHDIEAHQILQYSAKAKAERIRAMIQECREYQDIAPEEAHITQHDIDVLNEELSQVLRSQIRSEIKRWF